MDKYIYKSDSVISNRLARTYSTMFKLVPEDVLEKYNYKICTFWDLYNMDLNTIPKMHPILFKLNERRIHLLPEKIFEHLDIYQVMALTNITLRKLPFETLLLFNDKFKDEDIHIDELEARHIPYNKNLLKFNERLTKTINYRIKEIKQRKSVKSLSFYQTCNIISYLDLKRFLTHIDIDGLLANGRDLILNIPGIDECFIDENQKDELNCLFYYDKALECINNIYPYRKLEQIERTYSLSEVSALYFKNMDYKDIELIQFIGFALLNDKEIPHLEISQRVFRYFYEDVVKYMERRIDEKIKEMNKSKNT